MREPYKYDQGYTPRKNNKGVLRGYGWFVVPDWNITIAAAPKVGSSALKQFFHMNEMDDVRMVNRYDVNPNADIYFVVRHPHDRFASLWKSKCRDKANILDKRVHDMTPDELMAHIEAGNKDVHWTPQTTLLGDFNATLIPLEQLGDWFRDRNYGELGMFNNTEGVMPLSEELHVKICNFYAEDFLLYARALKLTS